jgi:hypothetical protein
MWEFLSAHPVWGCVYLSVICLTIMVCVTAVASKLTPWLAIADDDDETEARSKPAPPDRDSLH